VIDLDPRGKGARVSGQLPLEATPVVLLAADERLFAVTKDGRIWCFGAEPAEAAVHRWGTKAVPPEGSASRLRAFEEAAKGVEGYGLAWGDWDPGSLARLAGPSLRLVALQGDAGRALSDRAALAAAGLYGDRVSILAADPEAALLPPYFASVILASRELDDASLAAAFRCLRPYGGKILLPVPRSRCAALEARVREAGLEGASVESPAPDVLAVTRTGALPGAGRWTHEHADASNTRVSRDARVKAPLGLLWFGGSSHEGILPRHGHGPQPQVLDGRLFIEGVDMIRALDVYTGRVLWEARLPGVGRFYNNTSHQPGANASGTNFISTPEGLYVAAGRTCVRLDPATGRKLSEFSLPAAPGQSEPGVWGYINVVDEYLVGGAEPLLPSDPKRPELGTGDDPDDMDDMLLQRLLSLRGDLDAFSSSRRLVVLDRAGGRVLWSATAESGFRHNAVCAGGGRLYAIDRLSGPQVARLKKKGETKFPKPRLRVFDLKTGRELWKSDREVFGTWLSYSAERDILVEAGRVARDTINDEPKGMRAWRASDGTPLWEKKDYVGPAMIHGDVILMSDRACDLQTGALRARAHPLTGAPVPWTWSRNYGCNTPMAAQHLMTFRSGAAGFYDLAGDGGTGNFGGFRSSCTNNLVVADGLLVAPDYTRTCTCSYQNQTSIALVPMPENEMWTFFGTTDVKGPIRRVGINLGAPGDRRAEDGTLWLEHPSTGGRSPAVSVSVSGDKLEWFRRHASQVEAGPLPWVAASGAKGLKSLALTLDKDGASERSFRVRLWFAEPDGQGPGERVFGVSMNGREVLADFDVAKEAGGPRRAVVKEFEGVKAKKELKIAFAPRKGAPVLCGVEVVEEGTPVAEAPPVLPPNAVVPPPADVSDPLLRPAEPEEPERPAEVWAPASGWWKGAAGAGLVLILLVTFLDRRKKHATS
jgi:outer membrane protein assembly factor BamB